MSYNWNYNYPQIARDSGFNLSLFEAGKLDWSVIGSVDIDELIKDQNFERIEDLIFHLSEVPLLPILKSNVLESGVANYFGLAQLGLQYLLFCKKFLDETVTGLRDALRETRLENEHIKKQTAETRSELLQMHKKLQRLEEINEILYPCSMCTKNFVSNEMLNVHISRKHPHKSNDTKSVEVSDRTLINAIKLELEIKQLKERLNAAEREIKEANANVCGPEKEKEKETCLNSTYCQTYPLTESVGIQTNINEYKKVDDVSTITVGIQTNLNDDKEIDDAVDFELRKNSEILTEIKDKLLLFEKWKGQQMEDSNNSICEIKRKMEEIVEAMKKTDEVKMEVSDSFRESIKQLDETNEDKLNLILQKIEIFSKQFVNSGSELRVYNQKEKENLQEEEKLPKQIKTFSNSFDKKDQNVIIHVQEKPSSSKPNQIESYEDLTTSSDDDSESDDSTESKSDIVYEPPLTQQKTLKISEPETTQIIPKDDRLSYLRRRAECKKLLAKNLTTLGIDSNTKYLSHDKLKRTMDSIKKENSSRKKKYPNFFATRNKLKKFVEKLSKGKLKSDVRKIHKVAEQSSESETTTANSPESNVSLKLRKTHGISTSLHSLKDYDNELKEIIDSPIKRPDVFRSSAEIYNPEIKSRLKKPVPIPRKSVMFDLGSMEKG